MTPLQYELIGSDYYVGAARGLKADWVRNIQSCAQVDVRVGILPHESLDPPVHAPVKLFVMGGGDAHRTPEGRIFVGGRWREEQEWPLSRARNVLFYLHANGRLSMEKPGPAPPTRYLFDPADPVPTIGGSVRSSGTD